MNLFRGTIKGRRRVRVMDGRKGRMGYALSSSVCP